MEVTLNGRKTMDTDPQKDHSASKRDLHTWPLCVKRVFYEQPLVQTQENDQPANGQHVRDERSESRRRLPQLNLSALYSRGSVEGWLYQQFDVCNKIFNFYPPMRFIQGSFEWMNHMPDYWDGQAPTSFDYIELKILYEKSSTICSQIRNLECKHKSKEDTLLSCDTCTERDCDCSKLDDNAAEMFIGKRLSDIQQDEFKTLVEKDFSFCSEDIGNGKKATVFKAEYDINGHPCFSYFCKKTYFLEILSPIVVDDVVVAVLITGQYIPEKFKTIIKKRCADILNDPNVKLNDSYILHNEGKVTRKAVIEHFRNEAKRQSACLQERCERNWNHFRLSKTEEIADLLKNKKLDETLNKVSEWIRGIDFLVFYKCKKKKNPEDDQLVFKWMKEHDGAFAADAFKSNIPTQKLQYSQFIKRRGSTNGDNTIFNYADACLLLPDNENYPVAMKLIDSDAKPAFYIGFDTEERASHAFAVQMTKEYASHLRPIDYERLLELLGTIAPLIIEAQFADDTKALVEQMNKDRLSYDATLMVVSHEIAQQLQGAIATLKSIRSIWNELFYRCLSSASPEAVQYIKSTNDRFARNDQDLQSIYAYLEFLDEMIRGRASDAQILKRETFSLYKDCIAILFTGFRIPVRENKLWIIFENPQKIDIINDSYYYPFRAALSNLVSNAVKYCMPGTKIYIRAEHMPRNGIQPEKIRVTVTDFGEAIPDHMRVRIFDEKVRLCTEINEETGKPYQSKHVEGTGYGLHIVKESVEIYGGTCRAETLRLPVSEYVIPWLRSCLSERAKPYYQRNNISTDDVDRMRCALIQALDSKVYDRVVNADIHLADIFALEESSESGLTHGTLLRNINTPLYETRFMIEIPAVMEYDNGGIKKWLKLGSR
jgi:signal transduction histidine kinase